MSRNVFMDNEVPEEPEKEEEVTEEPDLIADPVLLRLKQEKDFTTTAAHLEREREKKEK